MKIAFIGTQGSGKTTSAYQLATELKKNHNDVYVLSEIARSCPFPINKDATIQTQLWIFGKQITREQSSKGKILITDRTLLDVFCYGIRVDGMFESLKPFIKEYMKTYDIIFYLTANDEYLINDGTRSTDKEFRDVIEQKMLKYIDELSINVTPIKSGDIDTMMKSIDNIKT